MTIFQLFTTGTALNGRPFGFCFEHEAETVDALYDAFQVSPVLCVNRLISVDDGRGRRMVRSRDRVMVGAAAVATLEIAKTTHWEPED